MAGGIRISPRERAVLTAIIEMYIDTGEPVASQAIARQLGNRDGMSSATIRNVMASLGEAGLLDQPHTSAGRIPAAKAFRFYVEQLNGMSRTGSPGLTQDRRDQIEDSFSGVSSRQQFLERTSHVLALISNGSGRCRGLERRLSCAGAYSLLAAGGRTGAGGRGHQRPERCWTGCLTLDHDLTHTELGAAANFLNENFHGWSMEKIRQELERRIEQERNEYDQLIRSVGRALPQGERSTATAMGHRSLWRESAT
jgi:heat-inducible transcriptional repressor